MVGVTNKNNRGKKLVDVDLSISYDDVSPVQTSTKKRIRRIAEPHLRPHKVKGHVYYYYCHGIDREIYLGDADTILRAVKATKIASGRVGQNLEANDEEIY